MKLNLNEFHERQPLYLRYLLATALFFTALLLRFSLLPVEEGMAFLTFYPATVLGFYLFGIRPGILLVLLSALSGCYIFTPPYWGFHHQPKGEIATTTFLISAFLIGAVVRRMQLSASQLREALSALNGSEQQYQSLLEEQTEIICRFTIDGVLLYVNDAFCHFFGKPKEQLIGQKWHPVAHPDDIPYINERLSTLRPENPVVMIENRVFAAGGEIRWGQFVNRAFFDTQDRLIEMQSVGRDITEQKATQEAMNQLNKLLNHIATRVPGVIFQYQLHPDGSSCFPYASVAFRDMFQLPPEAVKKSAAAMYAVIHPKDYEGLVASIRHSADTLEPWQKEFRLRFSNGNVRWLYGNALPEQEKDGSFSWYGFITEITERKGIEQTLRTLSVAVEQSPAIVLIADLDANIQYVNQQFTTTTGYAKEEVLGKNSRLLHSGLTPAETHQNMWNTLTHGQIWHGEMINKKKNGDIYWEESHISPTFDDQGRITHYVGVKLDITERKKIQTALHENQELFSKVFHSSPIGMAIYRVADNKIFDANVAFQDIFGYTHEDIVSKTVEELELWLDMDKLNDVGSVQNFEVCFRQKDNQALSTFLASLYTLEISGERCRLCMLIDITERKLLEQRLTASVDEIQDLYEHSPCGYHSVGPDHIILRMNQTELDWLGYTKEEVIGKMKVTDFLTKPSQEFFLKAFPKLIKDGYVENLEIKLLAKNGTTMPVMVAATAVSDANGNFMMSRTVLHDIRELKQTQQELLLMDRRKDEFLAMLAHELRNPLAPIRNTVQLLKRQEVKEPILKQSYDIIDRQVTQLTRLLDDLLDVARIMQGKMTLNMKPVQVDEIVEIAVETCRPLINFRKQRLNISLPGQPLWLNGDSVRLTQIIANLLNNAAKYTDVEGEIGLRATSADSDLIIQIRDSGIGIAPELLPYVFDLFTQANQGLAHSQGGIGVGLTLVRRLVELHGGTVSAESAGIGLGSLFTVRLPLYTPEEPRIAAISDKPALSKTKLRIMIVEDYLSAAESLALVLKIEGHQVEIADCGMQAIEKARNFHPQMALIDIGLPDMDGYEVAKRLRELPETQHSLLVALTGYAEDKDRAEAGTSRFDHYLLKPVDFEKLSELLAADAMNQPMVAH